MVNKIVLFGPNPSNPSRTGGVASHMRYLTEAIKVLGIKVEHYYTDWDRASRLPVPRALQRFVAVGRAALLLLSKTKRKKVAVHVNTSLYFNALLRDYLFILACRLKGYPVFLQVHGGRISEVESTPFGRLVTALVLRTVTLIGAFPGEQASEFEERGYVVRKMTNMVPGTKSGQSGDSEITRFLYLGHLTEEKGVLRATEAFLRLCRESGKESHLTIAGTGPLADKVDGRVQCSDCSDKVQITGHVGGKDLQDVLERSNTLLLPSEKEGFPLSFLECAERGMASIVTMESAIPHVFEEEKEYLGLYTRNEEELYSKMRDLVHNPSLRRSIGKAARRAVHRCCTIEAAAPEYQIAYQRVIAADGHPDSGMI